VTPRCDARGVGRGWKRSGGLRARWIGRRGTRARVASEGGGARLTIAIRWRRDGGRFGRGTRRDERKGD
jgi:hypothetical protein